MDEPAKPVVKAKKSSFKCPSFSVPAKSTVNQASKQAEETTGKSSSEKTSTQAQVPAATVTSGGDSESNLDVENTSTRPPQQNVHMSGDSSANKVPLETAVKKKKAKFEVKTSAEEVAGVKPTKKKDKTEKLKSEVKASEPGMKKEKQKKEPKEKKDKTEKSKSEEKAVEPGMKEEKQKKEPKEKKYKIEKSKSEEKAEPEMKKEKQKKEPKETLPVKSLTNDEYDAIFDDAIKNAMDLNMEEWEPKITSPIKVREPVKKKYSITVGKKSSEKPKQLSQQSSQATCPDVPQHDTPDEQHEVSVGLDEEEEDSVSLQQQEINDTETSIKDDVDDSKQTHDVSNTENQDQVIDDVEAVDENNNREEERMDQDDSDDDNENDFNLEPVVPDESAQQENETTPAGSEADSSDKQPDCQKAPVKRKKKPVPKSDKKPKLEPKQLPFDVKKETKMVDQIKEARKKKNDQQLSKKKKHDQDAKQPSEKAPKQEPVKIKDSPASDKKKFNKRQKMQERELDLNGTWVQCCNSTCMKWRHLPEINDPARIPERWTCSMNADKKYNNCSAAEEAYDESEHIYTKFTEGSVVWARMVGYPWWPAMVEIDPDVDTYFSIETQDSMVPTHYHVVFFDEKVSRSWVKAGHLEPFTGKEEDDGIIYQCSKKGVSYKKEIATAKKNAVQALSCTIKERIEQFGFAARYKGPWNISKASSTNKIPKSAKKQKAQDDITPEDILDDTTMDEVLDNTDILLDNVEEMLDSIDTQLDDSDADSEFIPEDLIIIEGARKRAGRKSSKSDCLKPLKKKAKTVKFNSEDEMKTHQQEDEKITKKKDSTDSRSGENIDSDKSEIQESSNKKSKTSLNLDSDIFTMEMETQNEQTEENHVKGGYIKLTSSAKNMMSNKVKKPQEEKKFKKQVAKEDISKQHADGRDSPKQAVSKSLTEMSHNDQSSDTSSKPMDLIMNNGDNGKVDKEFNLVEDDKKEVEHTTMQMKEITTDNESEGGFDLLGEDDMKHDQEHSEETPGCLVKESKTSEQENKPGEDEFDLIDVEYIENDGRVVPDVNNTQVKETVHRNPSQGLDTESDTEFNLDEHYMYESVSNASDKVRERGVVAVPVVNEIDEDSDPFDLMEE